MPEIFIINDIALSLAKSGHAVTVVTSKPNYPNKKFFSNREWLAASSIFEKNNDIKIYRTITFARSDSKPFLLLNYFFFSFFASIFCLYKFKKEEYDLTFTFQPTPVTAAVPGVLLKIFKKIPAIIWIQDIWPQTLAATGLHPNSFIYKFGEILSNFVYKNADTLLLQSKSYLKLINKYGNKSIYLPNYYTNKIIMGRKYYAKLKKSSDKSFDILFTGNIGSAQDFPNVLKAINFLKKYKNIHWHFIGEGRYFLTFKSIISANNLQEIVFLYSMQPQEKVQYYCKHADALLICLADFHAFKFTVPAKLQFYLKMGLPILGMINGESSKIIKKAKCGLVSNAGDYINLARNVLKLRSTPKSKLIEMGLNGKIYSNQFFDDSILKKKLEKTFYQEKSIFPDKLISRNRKPTFLVLLAARNGIDFIEQQISSILNQSYVNIKILISLDLSNDGTEEYVLDLASKYENISAIKNINKNNYASSNFFNLIKYVTKDIFFDYIALADQDDIWDSDKLIRSVSSLKSNKSDGYSSNVLAFWKSGAEKLVKKSYPQKKYDFLFESSGPGCTFTLTRYFFFNLKQFLNSADQELLSEIKYHDWLIYAYARANNYKWFIDPQVTMKYRQHDNNVIGARHGLKSYLYRIKNVLFGDAFKQSEYIQKIIGIKKISTIYSILNFKEFRRNLLDQYLFLIASIFYRFTFKL